MSRARLSLVGSVLAVGAALAAGHARTGGGGVAEADVRRAGIAAPATPGGDRERARLPARARGRREARRRRSSRARRRSGSPTPTRAACSTACRRSPPMPREEPFAIREDSLPPPRTGRTARASFPPGEAAARPEAAPAGPLEVLRRMPEGEVPLAPHLSITFSQPMVALDSHAGLAREAIPARLSPQPPGEWRWVGTRTLVFEPEGRFADGDRLPRRGPGRHARGDRRSAGERVAWSFSTPAAAPRGATPRGRSRAPRRADVRGLRPARRPGGGPRLAPRARGRRRCPGAPRLRRRGRGGRGGRAPREGDRARALRRLPVRARAARRRGGDGDGRRRHALGRGPAAHHRRAGVGVPHLRAVPRARPRVRLERALHAVRPVAGRAHEPRRPEARCARSS